ncbi:MAG: WecB/TagA/CpsF family glycosyltransferase [Gammaproteobacteria bacterium]|nr:WecB/TagA/CpsF family glycosyltransferase [Gammaproteobacteria bacterium]
MKGHVVEKNIDILGYEVTQLSAERLASSLLEQLNSQPTVVNTINPHSYVVAKGDGWFREALTTSDYLLPDGVGIVLAARFLGQPRINRVSGPDFFKAALNQLEKKKGRVFFLGSTEKTLNLIQKRISKEYPNICMSSFSPPFKDNFTDEDIEAFASVVNEFSPDVLFVGLTAPKQEKLILRMNSKLHAKIVSGVGAAFDYFAGTVNEPSGIWSRLKLEWFRRFLSEPKRLWRRNFVSAPIFLGDVFKLRLKKALFKQKK